MNEQSRELQPVEADDKNRVFHLTHSGETLILRGSDQRGPEGKPELPSYQLIKPEPSSKW